MDFLPKSHYLGPDTDSNYEIAGVEFMLYCKSCKCFQIVCIMYQWNINDNGKNNKNLKI